jgi:hypothetical protein
VAIGFDGVDDKIDYANHLTAFDGATKLTISVWVYPQNGGNNFGYWIDAMGAASGEGNTHGWAVLRDGADETTLFLAFRNASSTESATAPNGTLTADTWKHVYIVYDGTQAAANDRVKLWVNGSTVSLTYFGTQPSSLGTTDQAVRLGSGESLFGKGRLAELGIWTDAIPPTGTSPMNELLNVLRRGTSPLWYRHNLLFYAPLIRTAEDRLGRSGTATVTGTTVESHLPMLYPISHLHPMWAPTAAAGNTSITINRNRGTRPRPFAPGLAR